MAATSSASSSTKKAKAAKAATGAPSQHNQSSRKGKKAWRKNVDLQDVEEALEGMREEERVVGTSLQKMKDSDLFQIDVQGDAQVKKSMKFSAATLTSTKILSERSAVPAVFSRPSTSQKRKPALSREEKDRLLRIGKRPRKGPFNSIVDPTEDGSALAEVTEAAKSSGKYDVWGAPAGEDVEMKDGLEHVQKKPVKAPSTTRSHPDLNTVVPAVVTPHQGASYNPPVDAHQALLQKAQEDEEKRLKEETRFSDVKEKMSKARIGYDEDGVEEGVAPGMTVQKVDDEEEEGDDNAGEVPVRKAPARKTKQQRAKAAKLLAEKRALLEIARQKRLLASIGGAKTLHKASRKLQQEQEYEVHARKLARLEKLRKKGLAGEKFGRHKVPEEKVDVQLGEDLSESFRGLKTEGNLFRDRFQSMQQRALIEPRVPVVPKKRRTKFKEYEKHAWKRFE